MPSRDRARANPTRAGLASGARCQTGRSGSEPRRASRTSATGGARRGRHGAPLGGAANGGGAGVRFDHHDRLPLLLTRIGTWARVATLAGIIAMKLLSHLSPNGDGLPRPADARLLALGFAAWESALAEAEDERGAARARQWSATSAGRGLLAAIFGNSPFLSGLAATEWGFADPHRRGGRRSAVRGNCRGGSRARRSRRKSGGVDATAAHRQAACRLACRGCRACRRLVARTADGRAQPLCRGGDRCGGA